MQRRRVSFENLERRVLLSSTEFAVIGDYGFAGQPEADVANLIKGWNPDAIITVGDNNYFDGSGSTIDANVGQYFQEFIGNYKGVYGAGAPANRFWPSLGNHDQHAGGAEATAPSSIAYQQYFTLPDNERYYDFVLGPVHFFALNSDPAEPDGRLSTSVQGQWLHNGLAASTSQWNIAFFHHPPYNSGAEHGSTPDMQWPFKQWGADAVFAGHEHTYERIIDPTTGFPYFVDGLGGQEKYDFTTPVAGSQSRYAADYGAMKVDADDQRMTFQFITRTGVVIDTYTLNAETAIPPVPTGVVATPVVSTEVNVSWTDASTKESEFRVERSLDNTNFTQIATVGPDVTSYQDRSAIPGTHHYYYRVRAANSVGASAASTSDDATTPAATSSPLISFGATWKYLDNGSNQGTSWRARTFNDGSWSSGAAELGYGDNDEATLVSYGPTATNKFITTYFRKAFTVADPAAVGSLLLRFLRDDGAVIYLNGTEVNRSNFAEGTFSYTTLAERNMGGAEESALHSVAIDPHMLVAGSNVIAVELHQFAVNSSDISFNLELTDVGVTGVPPLNALAKPVGDSRIDLSWTDNFNVETGWQIDRSTDGIHFAPLTSLAASQTAFSDTSGIVAETTYYYRLSVTGTGGSDSPPIIVSATPQKQGPIADIVDVSPDYRKTAVSSISIIFSETVTGFTLADLSFTHDDDATNLLSAGQALSTSDGGKTWTLSGLSGITAENGRYLLQMDSSAAGGIVSVANGTVMLGVPSESWIMDTTAPAASSAPDLATSSDTGASSSDNLTRNTIVTLTGTAEPFTTVTVLVDGVSVGTALVNDAGKWARDATLAAGTHQATATIKDRSLNSGPTSAAGQFTIDVAAPTVDIVDVTPDPRSTSVSSISINFNEAVANFDVADLSLTRTGTIISIAGATLTSSDGAQSWTLSGLSAATTSVGTYVLTLNKTGITDIAGNALTADASDTWQTTTPPAAQVVGRLLFYNNSTYDGYDATANAGDDLAIATDKSALISGKAAFANYSSYSKGINGLMVDISGLPAGAMPGVADFSFKNGNDLLDPATWSAGPTPTIDVRPSAGTGGSTRITLIWKDHGSASPDPLVDAVTGGWLRITVLPTANTGLAVADVFFFGNAVAEGGDATNPDYAITDVADYYAVRDHLRGYESFPAPTSWSYDFNRDGVTDVTDMLLVRASATTSSTALKLITASPAPAPVQFTGDGVTDKPAGLTTTPGMPSRPAGVPSASKTRIGLRSLVGWGRK